jgi:hypothetical protein
MHNKKLIRFAESFILLPLMTISVPAIGNLAKPDSGLTWVPSNVSVQNEYIPDYTNSIVAVNQAVAVRNNLITLEGDEIDAYFKKGDMPLYGTGKIFAEEADKNGLDWRLLPAIAVRESSGGKHACDNVPHAFFGWGSCSIGFSSDEDAIQTLARNLGGNESTTASAYHGKSIRGILETYNPPSVVPDYAEQVIDIMNQIGPEKITVIPNATVIPSTQVSSYALSVQTG